MTRHGRAVKHHLVRELTTHCRVDESRGADEFAAKVIRWWVTHYGGRK
jgi:hypothetical protein